MISILNKVHILLKILDSKFDPILVELFLILETNEYISRISDDQVNYNSTNF